MDILVSSVSDVQLGRCVYREPQARHKICIELEGWFDDNTSRKYIEREIIMTYPIDDIRRQSRMANAELRVAVWTSVIFVAALITYTVDGFDTYSKPDLSRIDVYDTLNDIPSYLGPIDVLLWSGPVYTLILYSYTSKKHMFRSFIYPARCLANQYYQFREERSFLEIISDWWFWLKLYLKEIRTKSKKAEPEGTDKYTRLKRRKARR